MKPLHIFCLIFLAILLLSETGECLKLLHFIPGFSKSHYLFNNRLSCSLKEAGHEIVIVNNQLMNYIGENKSPCNITQFQLHNTLLDEADEAQWMAMQNDYAFSTDRIGGVRELMAKFNQLTLNVCRLMRDSHEVMEQLQNYNFDASLSQVFGYCNLGITKQLDLPIIFVSGGNYILDHVADTMGLPFPTSFVPSPISSFSDKMTFKQRLQNLAMHLLNFVMYRVHFSVSTSFEERELFKTDPLDNSLKSFLNHGSEIPIMLLNGEGIVDLPRPISTGVHYNGELNPKSMQRSQTTKLDEKWSALLNDKSKKGLILLSFGTVANTDKMPASMNTSIIKALQKFPGYHIIWKVNTVFTVENSEHIHVVDWVPQRELLNHPMLKLFITHGGYNSLLETCQAGVPVVAIPLFADQFGNALRAERLGFSRTVFKDDLTAESLSGAVQDLLEDDSYAKNARRLAAMITDRIWPNERLVNFQVERAVRHHKHLPRLLQAIKLNWFQYYSIDIGAGMILSLWIMLRVVVGIYRCTIQKVL